MCNRLSVSEHSKSIFGKSIIRECTNSAYYRNSVKRRQFSDSSPADMMAKYKTPD